MSGTLGEMATVTGRDLRCEMSPDQVPISARVQWLGKDDNDADCFLH